MRKFMWISAALLAAGSIYACKDDKELFEEESFCGDGVCDADEDADSCPEDCDDGEEVETECGDGVCEEGETPANCPEDCEEEAIPSHCGDGVCDEDEDAQSCPQDCDPDFDDGATCTAVYALDVTMEITETPGGLGDKTAEGLSGQIALRFSQDEDEASAPLDDGLVEVLHLFVQNKMDVLIDEVDMTIRTDVNGFTPTCNGETDIPDKKDLPDSCEFDQERDIEAQATGRYAADDTAVNWHRCDTPPQYNSPGNEIEDRYTPDHESNGPGCLDDYKSQGNVNCDGDLCVVGGLQPGDNEQDNTWNQPLAAFTLSADGKNVSLEATHVPNFQDGKTFVRFEGTQTDIDCEDLAP